MDGVVSAGKGEDPAGDGQISAAVDAVIRTVHGECTAIDGQSALRLYTLLADGVLRGVCHFLCFCGRGRFLSCRLGGELRRLAAVAAVRPLRRCPALGGWAAVGPRPVLTARTSSHAAGGKTLLSGHGDRGTALSGGQIKGSAVHLQSSAGADGISLGGNGKFAIRHIQKSQRGVIGVFSVETVLTGGDGKCAARHGQAVLACHAVLGGGDGVAAACNSQLVLGHHPVACLGVNGQTAGAIEGQVGFREHHGINVVLVDGGIAAAVAQGIFRPLCQGEEHLVGVFGIDGGGVSAGDIRAGQDDLDLVRIIGVHHDLSVC